MRNNIKCKRTLKKWLWLVRSWSFSKPCGLGLAWEIPLLSCVTLLSFHRKWRYKLKGFNIGMRIQAVKDIWTDDKTAKINPHSQVRSIKYTEQANWETRDRRGKPLFSQLLLFLLVCLCLLLVSLTVWV